jgi:hypothetical protein
MAYPFFTHFKNLANAADSRAHGYCIVKGFKSKKTGITPWRLTKTNDM